MQVRDCELLPRGGFEGVSQGEREGRKLLVARSRYLSEAGADYGDVLYGDERCFSSILTSVV